MDRLPDKTKQDGVFSADTVQLVAAIDAATQDPELLLRMVYNIQDLDSLEDASQIAEIRNNLASAVRSMRPEQPETGQRIHIGRLLLNEVASRLSPVVGSMKEHLDNPPDTWTPALITSLGKLNDAPRTVPELSRMTECEEDPLRQEIEELRRCGVVIEVGIVERADKGSEPIYYLTPIGDKILSGMARRVLDRELDRFQMPAGDRV